MAFVGIYLDRVCRTDVGRSHWFERSVDRHELNLVQQRHVNMTDLRYRAVASFQRTATPSSRPKVPFCVHYDGSMFDHRRPFPDSRLSCDETVPKREKDGAFQGRRTNDNGTLK